VALGCALLAASASAQNLQVVAPAAGDVWTFGSTQAIKWRARHILGFPNQIFGTITLERAGRQVAVISSKASLVTRVFVGRGPTPGTFWDYMIYWKVQRSGAPNFVAAHDYRIRLHPVPPDSSYPDAVSDQFSIVVETATDSPGNQIMIKKGDCIISSFTVALRANDPNHVIVRVEVKNLRSTSASGMQLHLAKNHLAWPLVRVPEIKAHARWQTTVVDDAPAPFQTNRYIAILSLDDPIAHPESVLDRKEASYRRSGTVIGHP
jgi:hypothetical protein